jgi:hypothetical protein
MQLTIVEKSELALLEKKIKDGLENFMQVGNALLKIQEKKLYRAKYSTFEDYCHKVWNISRNHGYRLITSAKIAEEFPNVKNQRAARELSKVPPPRRKQIMDEIEGEATASAIKELVDEPGAIADEFDIEVPVECVDLWQKGGFARELLGLASTLKASLIKAQENKDLLFIEVDLTDNIAKLNQIQLDMKRAIPYAVCPDCQGVIGKCNTCKGRGFISKFYWDTFIPEEKKALRK